mmetsp:Transcript_19052/g.35446  ORF Transcript_19052/g.35446 Transcript_19052/m.35446 type:complete len:219 (-) Transcript_19052:631-1287(-)
MSSGGARRVAGAFAWRLLTPSSSSSSSSSSSAGGGAADSEKEDPRSVILSLILSNLELHAAGDRGGNLALILLGLNDPYASSHLARGWEVLASSALVGCQSLVFTSSDGLSSPSDEPLMGRDSLIEFLRLVLSRLVVDCHQRNYALEEGSALPLSIAALRVVTVLNDIDYSRTQQASDRVSSNDATPSSGIVFDEERSKIGRMIASEIASCAAGGGHG